MVRWWFLIVALLVSIAACEQQQAEEAGTTEETADVDPAAVEDAIRSSADRFEQAMLAGDVEAMTALYTDDAVVMPQGMPRMEGTEAIRSGFQEMISMGQPTAF